MDSLKQRFQAKAAALNAEIKEILAVNGKMQVDTVDISQCYGGMRDITSMIWEPSLLDAQEGIRFRGYSIPQLQELLPKAENGTEPLPEGLFYLMLVGEIPTADDVAFLTKEWHRRATVPAHVYAAIDAMPVASHPMTQLVMGITAMQTESIFAENYQNGMPKSEYWDASYEDTMNLIAKLPHIAAYIYRRSFKDGSLIASDETLDWAGNFANMLGVTDRPDFKELVRLYMTIHADHEGGNASAHTTHLVGSTLADPYLSLSAAMCALAGPLHGLANQEVVRWIYKMYDKIGTHTPSKEQIADYINDTLAAKRVVPGYGHAVLRKPDPRFTAQQVFGQKHCADDSMVQTVWHIFETAPVILGGKGNIKNPWPNVDAHSGALLMHYGLTDFNFYTVMFGVSRALGVLVANCWSRASGFPIERPKSVTTEWIKQEIARQKA